jgi:phenylacetic acid degradation operon negative regulatory protein
VRDDAMGTAAGHEPPTPAYATLLLLGESFRPEDGPFWLGELLEAAAALGVKARSMRTVVQRMTNDGWFDVVRVGRRSRYRLSPSGAEEVRRGDVRVFELDEPPWDGRWRLVLDVHGRGDAEGLDGLAKPLRWLGFGRLGAGQWVSPHDRTAEVRALADRLGLGDRLAIFDEAVLGGGERSLVHACWDLRSVAARYEGFTRRHRSVVEDAVPAGAEPVEAFRRLFRLDHDMLRLLRDDPNLPAALLPDDWPGHTARRLYRAGRERYSADSRAFVAGLRGTGDP